MSKTFLNALCFFLMLDQGLVFGQYIPLPLDSNHYWIQYDSKWAPPNPNPNLPINTLYRVTLIKDSLINNKVYHKMGRKGPSKDGINGGFLLLNSAFLWEDTVSQKVYFYNFSDGSDILLYDFSKSLGDTIKDLAALAIQTAPGTPILTVDLIVVNTTTVLVGDGSVRKKYSLQFAGTTIQANDMVEGIGSSGGLLTPNFTSESEWTSLVCHGTFQPAQSIYHFANAQNPLMSCDYLTSISFHNVEENGYKVFPNPTNGLIGIKSSRQEQVRILNLTGQCLIVHKLELGMFELDLNSYPLGYYLLEFTNGESTQYIKVLKTE